MMRVAFATSECVPYVKTGGLADVSGALPAALQRLGCDVKVFVPLYHSIDKDRWNLKRSTELQESSITFGYKTVEFDVWFATPPGSDAIVHFIDCPEYFHRSKLYTDEPDEDERFIFFQHAILSVLQRYHWAPDVLHCNDWQTALLPVFLKELYAWDALFKNTRSLLSLHNMGFQGQFATASISRAGLSLHNHYPGGPFEYYGDFNFLKAGILYADALSTVSENYAAEIQTAEYGAGLHGILAERRHELHGILNGIDTETWNPRKDPLIPYTYSSRNLGGKWRNKRALQDHMGLPVSDDVALLGVVSRLGGQKGFDLFPSIIDRIAELPVQFAVLGSGDSKMEAFFRRASRKHSDTIRCHIGYDEKLSHLITAGADVFLMPSLYEPCGLNQMYSLNYGTIPVVRKTGGLADTVLDYHEHKEKGNGFTFTQYSPGALLQTIQRATTLFPEKAIWQEIMRRGMAQDFSWTTSAKRYVELYESIQASVQPRRT